MSQTTDCIYDYIRAQWEENQQMPTLQEMASACEIARTTVIYHLDKLEARGDITREPYKARGIRLTASYTEQDDQDDEDVAAVHAYLRESIEAGMVPTQAEIAEHCYLSRYRVRCCLSDLEARGKIVVGEGSRTIRLL